MAGFTPDEGEHLIANLIYVNADVDRGTNLELGLFTDATPGETITEATISEPTGGSYARITLTDASWTVTGDGASYAQQSFVASGSDYSAPVYGYFVATTGTTPRLLHVEIDASGPRTMVNGATYNITLSNTVA